MTQNRQKGIWNWARIMKRGYHYSSVGSSNFKLALLLSFFLLPIFSFLGWSMIQSHFFSFRTCLCCTKVCFLSTCKWPCNDPGGCVEKQHMFSTCQASLWINGAYRSPALLTSPPPDICCQIFFHFYPFSWDGETGLIPPSCFTVECKSLGSPGLNWWTVKQVEVEMISRRWHISLYISLFHIF